MLSRFFSKLINGPFYDPGIYLEFDQQKKIFMFDLGDLLNFSSKKIVKVNSIFITHTHIDHFYGFDKILRVCLGRRKIIRLYGPPGLAINVECKLSSYNWNIIKNCRNNLVFIISEVYGKYLITREYQSINYFRLSKEKIEKTINGVIISKKFFKVYSAVLDHKTKSIAFSIKEKHLIKILNNNVKKIGFVSKKWMNIFKNFLLFSNIIQKKFLKTNYVLKLIRFSILYFSKKNTKILIGSKIVYITDTSYDEKIKKNIFKLSTKSSHIFIEGVFLLKDKKLAVGKKHLIVNQTGRIARISNSKRYTIFHHSARYKNKVSNLKKESNEAFYKNNNMQL